MDGILNIYKPAGMSSFRCLKKLPKEIEAKLKKVYEKFKPLSIFVYGSYATNSTNSKSDTEVAVIFENENYVSRAALKEFINHDKISIYPMRHQELINYQIDTPFEKKIFIYFLCNGGAVTIHGEKIIENLPKPKLTAENFINDLHFNLGIACAAFQIKRDGKSDELANNLLYKSCFFTLRNLKWKNAKISSEYDELIKTCNDWRTEKIDQINIELFYKNISFINKYAISFFECGGNK